MNKYFVFKLTVNKILRFSSVLQVVLQWLVLGLLQSTNAYRQGYSSNNLEGLRSCAQCLAKNSKYMLKVLNFQDTW